MADENILLYYRNRSLVFQAVVEIELQNAEARVKHLRQVLDTARQMDVQFGQEPITEAAFPPNLLDPIRAMFPKAAGLTDEQLREKLTQDPEFLNT